jgi:hypothetical protein
MVPRHFVIPKHIVGYLLLYNFFVWLTFAIIYRLIDFAKHFSVPDFFMPSNWSETSYYAFMVQTQMYGTAVVPKTPFARGLVAVHAAMAWSQTIIFLAPWVVLSARASSR